ncbi:MAG: hypothetical protein AAF845_11545 [Bacteroidota bacterium]
MSSLRRLTFVLAALVAAGGCDSGTPMGTDPRDDDLFEPGCDLSTAVQVRPTGTYLRVNDDDPDAPTLIRLADVGVAPGDRLALERFGEYQYRFNNDPADVRREMAAVFSSSNDLLGEGEDERVVNALDAGDDYATPPTRGGGVATDIAEDFQISDSTVVVVPTGAVYLFVAPPDDRFRDNADDDDDYRVCITEVS